jgi:outer membrane protein assembly factor BamB
MVYFGSGDGNLYALDSATGELRWKFKTGDVVHASPALAMAFCFLEAGTVISMRWTR